MQSPPNALDLLEAARSGDHDMAMRLLDRGVPPWAIRDLDGRTPLHKAAEHGNLEVVKALLQRGFLVNTVTSNNSTALNLAAHNGHMDVMEVLLASHADVNTADSSGCTPLHALTSAGHVPMMQLVLGAGANMNAADSKGLTALHMACSSGMHAATELLVASGASLEAACTEGHTALHYASQHGCLEVVQVLLRAGASLTAVTSLNCETPLHLAAAAGDKEVVQLLVSSGAQLQSKDARGHMALHTASAYGHIGAMECLLGVDGTAAHVNALGQDGAPLHLACINGRSEVVRLLLKASADVNARSPAERTPLHQAAIIGHSELVEQLLAAGADPGALTRTGANGLQITALRGYHDALQQLLAAMAAAPGGCPVDALYDGMTALQLATNRGHTSCVKLLLAAGADASRVYEAHAVGAGGGSLEGASALHYAVQMQFASLVPLLATPANMAHVWEGNTPLHLALGADNLNLNLPDMAQALVAAGSPAGVTNTAGATAMSLAACSISMDMRALLPAMVRRECEAYKQQQQQQQQGMGSQQQQQCQQVGEQQEPDAVLAAVENAVLALLHGSVAYDTSEAASDICSSCIQAMMEVLGGAAATRLMQQVLCKFMAADAAAAKVSAHAAALVAAAAEACMG